MHRVVIALMGGTIFILMFPAAPAQQSPISQQAGQQVFQQRCAMCHSILPGATLVGPSLAGEMKTGSPAKAAASARNIILKGKGRMPGQKAQLSLKDLDHLLAYLKTL